MAKPDDTSPATKADIKMLMDSIGKLYDANEKWKNELKAHFDLQSELVRHDLLGAKGDRVANHEDRLQTLERHAGLAVA